MEICKSCYGHSATGTRTRVTQVRAECPNQLDYSGDVPLVVFDKCRHLPSLPLSIEYMPLMLIAFVHGSAAACA